jgi:hypothetical protein
MVVFWTRDLVGRGQVYCINAAKAFKWHEID